MLLLLLLLLLGACTRSRQQGWGGCMSVGCGCHDK
jgi:hypothetical protein